MLIRPLLQNVTVLLLFLLPLVTMRTYSEEKRVGHDRAAAHLAAHRLPDHPRQVPRRAGALRRRCSAVTLIHFGLLFVYGNPEWKPLADGLPRACCCFGGCFISVGLFISSLTKNQIVAGVATFAVFLLLWVIDWIGSSRADGRGQSSSTSR